jgi:hypothetical protein
LRRGLGNAIQAARSPSQLPHADIVVALGIGPKAGGVHDGGATTVTLSLLGPGEVTGFDPSLVTRVEPRPLSRNFSPNYFPHIEFALPDLPWMFSPYAADSVGGVRRLTPWFVLIAVPTSAASLQRVEGRTLPLLVFNESPAPHLPKLEEAWAWAHVQVAMDDLAEANRKAEIQRIIQTQPDRVLARLICPRQLQPATTYLACVVPTFKAGVQAALGDKLDDPPDLRFAWNDAGQLEVTEGLPVYYSWEFTSAEAGDFEQLVRRLTPRRVPKETGLREIDITNPAYGMTPRPPLKSILLEGALWAPDAERGPWPGPNPAEQNLFQQTFQNELQVILERPANIAHDSVNPTVAPPLYGRWFAARDTLPLPVTGIPDLATERPVWFRDLNLDARERTVAGFGTRVIQREQEQLMNMAWQQIGDLRDANRLLVRTQFAREVNNSLYRRHFMRMPIDWLLAITWRLHWRIFVNGESLTELLRRCWNWGAGGALGSPWIIRSFRPGGPLGGAWGTEIGEGGDGEIPRHLPTPIADGGGDSGGSITESLPGEPDDISNGCTCAHLHGGVTAIGQPPDCPEPTTPCPDPFDRCLTDSGHPLASQELFPHTAWQAFDHNPNTKWLAPFTSCPWLYYHLGLGVHKEVTSYAVTSASDTPGRDPKNWTFEGSHDALHWNVLDTRTNVTFASRGQELTYVFANDIAYEYYRLNISANHGDIHTQLAELQLFEDPSVFEDLTECGTAKASDDSPLTGHGVDKLFDNNAGTSWLAVLSAAAWVRYKFADGREHIVTTYTLTCADCVVERDPRNWTFEGSHDGTSWTVLDTQTNVSFQHRYQEKRFPISNVSGFLYYRLNISANHGSPNTELAELRMLGVQCEEWPLCDDPDAHAGCLYPTPEAAEDAGPNPGFQFPDVPRHGAASSDPAHDSEDAAAAREAARRQAEYMGRIARIAQRQGGRVCTLDVNEVRGAILAFLDPEVTSVQRVRARLAYDESEWDPVDPLHWIMAHPKIDKPMYEGLRDFGQQHLMPGLDKVPPETITLVKTNPRFIEAFMVGANHEFGRELLWREYPTDQRGTAFRQFWDVAGRFPAPATIEEGYDIPEIVGWNPTFVLGQTLTTHGGNRPDLNRPPGDASGQVVLLIRGELLRRYPTADIYAVEANWVAQGDREPTGNIKRPIFRGTLEPDVTFFGFDLTVDQAAGGDELTDHPGYYFAIQQQPFDPRFGMDVADFEKPRPVFGLELPREQGGSPWDRLSWIHLVPEGAGPADLALIQYVDLAANIHPPSGSSFPDGNAASDWGRNSSNMAQITWQLPVRILIHAEDMLSEPGSST